MTRREFFRVALATVAGLFGVKAVSAAGAQPLVIRCDEILSVVGIRGLRLRNPSADKTQLLKSLHQDIDLAYGKQNVAWECFSEIIPNGRTAEGYRTYKMGPTTTFVLRSSDEPLVDRPWTVREFYEIDGQTRFSEVYPATIEEALKMRDESGWQDCLIFCPCGRVAVSYGHLSPAPNLPCKCGPEMTAAWNLSRV